MKKRSRYSDLIALKLSTVLKMIILRKGKCDSGSSHIFWTPGFSELLFYGAFCLLSFLIVCNWKHNILVIIIQLAACSCSFLSSCLYSRPGALICLEYWVACWWGVLNLTIEHSHPQTLWHVFDTCRRKWILIAYYDHIHTVRRLYF